MSKQINQFLDGWVRRNEEERIRQHELENKLSPNMQQTRSIVAYGESIQGCLRMIETVSTLAHQGAVDFDVAQIIINKQRQSVLHDINNIKEILSDKVHE